MEDWQQIVALVSGLAASAFALVRLILNQQKVITERFVGFLEASLRRQEATIAGFRSSIENLSAGVNENTQVVRRLAEHAQITFASRSNQEWD